jgi:hypothetical protein
VEHHSQVRVKRRGNDEKFLARVVSIANECDVAMLEVDNDEFWENLPAIGFGALPHLED